MAKIVQFKQTGGPEVLELVETDLADPAEGEVKIAVQAVGLNRADAMLRLGQYIEDPVFPSRLGYDAAGEVLAVGPGVDNVAVGDRVMTIPTFSQGKYGVYGDQAIVPSNSLWPWPKGMPASIAAAVGVQYTTVYFALKYVGKVDSGDTVLLTAATGGVGFAAIEVAKDMDLTVIATTRKPSKKQSLLDAGADHVIVTDDEDLSDRVSELTGGQGVQFVFDPISGKSVPPLVDSLAPGGVYALYGLLDPSDPQIPMMPLLAKGLTLTGYTVFAFTGYPSLDIPQQTEAVQSAKDYLLPRLADGRLKPTISETFPLSEVVKAHQALESNNQVGKIILTV